MRLPDFVMQAYAALLQIGPVKIAKTGITLVAILAVGLLAKEIDFEGILERIDFHEGSDAAWYQGKAGYVLAAALFTSIGGPRQIVAFFGAYIFGFWAGLAVATIAATLGCALTATVARLFERRARSMIQGKIDIAFDYWRNHAFWTTIIIRLLPVGSNFLTTIAAGVTGIPFLWFIAGSFVGYIPQMAVFSLMGSGVDVGETWQISLAIGLFVALTVFGLWIYSRYRRKIRSRRLSGVEGGEKGAGVL